mmetsp:Transcript_2016/g.2893  ORF Transcript_2016/g.2893 Transcript_2016/m.2893 type:complete len:112 (-) Transcript_2016:17-352(-)
MSQQGVSLQSTNTQLVQCIEELRIRRQDLMTTMSKEQAERTKIEENLKILREKLQRIDHRLSNKREARDLYEKTLRDTEAAYSKIVESSQTLLHVVKRESQTLHERYPMNT